LAPFLGGGPPEKTGLPKNFRRGRDPPNKGIPKRGAQKKGGGGTPLLLGRGKEFLYGAAQKKGRAKIPGAQSLKNIPLFCSPQPPTLILIKEAFSL